MSPYPLLSRLPQLAASASPVGLLAGPTPVQALRGTPTAWLKRDDLSAADYGGNKIRKLDFLLAQARARGIKELIAFGYAGSNFVAATAWHGAQLGLHTRGLLLPQEPANYVADNLSVALHVGATLSLHRGEAGIAAAALAHELRSRAGGRGAALWIPPGGSSPLGVLGFINAALELRAQVQAGVLPPPQTIYVAFSSMGTVAGLALGLELAQLPARLMAVQVVGPRYASPQGLRKLVMRSAALLDQHAPGHAALAAPALARVQIRGEFFGEAYARPTAATTTAMARFTEASGARADSAYSGKALACLYHDLDAGQAPGPVLFWHTYNGHGLPASVQRPAPASVPAGLRGYF